ncbi:MAG TPA: hypothetical protein VGO57_14795 [Verrucomicrobiae bacterium]|jgi:hypothetical protein
MEKRLSQFISLDGLGKNADSQKSIDGAIHLLLILIKDEDLNKMDQRISCVVETLLKTKCFIIESISLSLIVSRLDRPGTDENSSQTCEQAAIDLAGIIPGQTKTLYVHGNGRYGIFGHPKIKTIGPLLVGYDAVLTKLASLEYGEFQKYKIAESH